MLATDNVLELVNGIPRHIIRNFGGTACGMYLSDRRKVYYSDLAAQSLITDEDLKRTTSLGEGSGGHGKGVLLVPLRVGVKTVGALGIVAAEIGHDTLEAVTSLISIAVERAGAVEKLAHAEASRESERLRSILLDSVTHDFRTPLTSIKVSAQSLLGGAELDESQRRELLTVIDEESDRLNRLVGEAAEMAQLDAGALELRIEPHHIQEAIEGALDTTKNTLSKYVIEVKADKKLPLVQIDLRRIEEVIAQLLDNAAKYSPPNTKITIESRDEDRMLVTSVADQGLGIDDFDQALIFDKF
jgi:two-component system sensor histidine kinase KdpD